MHEHDLHTGIREQALRAALPDRACAYPFVHAQTSIAMNDKSMLFKSAICTCVFACASCNPHTEMTSAWVERRVGRWVQKFGVL